MDRWSNPGLSVRVECHAGYRGKETPRRFTVGARSVEAAAELLARSNASVLDAACAVGYEDPSNLARAFREVTGVSPRQHGLCSAGPRHLGPGAGAPPGSSAMMRG